MTGPLVSSLKMEVIDPGVSHLMQRRIIRL